MSVSADSVLAPPQPGLAGGNREAVAALWDAAVVQKADLRVEGGATGRQRVAEHLPHGDAEAKGRRGIRLSRRQRLELPRVQADVVAAADALHDAVLHPSLAKAFAAAVEEIVCAAVENRDRPAEPLRSTPFADEFWSVCNPGLDVAAPFRRGPRSEELYRALVTPSCGVTASHVAAGDPLEPGQVLSLATPVETDGAGGLRPDHAFYPFRVEVPEAHRPAVHAILAVMRDEPALTAERLTGARLEGVPGVPDALRGCSTPGWCCGPATSRGGSIRRTWTAGWARCSSRSSRSTARPRT